MKIPCWNCCRWYFHSIYDLYMYWNCLSLQEKRIASLDAANARLMSALSQLKERYSMQTRNGISPTNPTKLQITENGEFRNSSNCWTKTPGSTERQNKEREDVSKCAGILQVNTGEDTEHWPLTVRKAIVWKCGARSTLNIHWWDYCSSASC